MILSACAAPPPAAPKLAEQKPAEAAKMDFSKALADKTITIAWIPKALNNPVFETGKIGAETKAKELSA